MKAAKEHKPQQSRVKQNKLTPSTGCDMGRSRSGM